MRLEQGSTLGRVLLLAVALWGVAIACNLSNAIQSGPSQPPQALTAAPVQLTAVQAVETLPPTAQPAETQLPAEQTTAPQPPVTQPAPAKPAASPTAANNIFMPSISSGTSITGTEPSATIIPVDAYVDVTASPNTTLKVGESLTVVGKPVEIGLPVYELNVRDDGVEDAPSMVQATYENKITPLTGTSAVLELVSTEASLDQVTFVLRAKAPGITAVTINVAGEVHPSTGQASIEAGASGSVLITVK
ncbi:MAG TPA: hypothetical protein VF498_12300 [Anaerolineales bacterium]